jgi:type IV pilus assembly protein PilC
VAKFKYTAMTPEGVRVRTVVDAPSAGALRNELTLADYHVLKVKQKVSFNEIEITKQRVPRQVIIHFSRQLSAFVKAGIPLTDALAIVESGTDNKRFKAVLAEVTESLRNGRTLSEALQSHASIFPPYYLGIIRSAEQTGQLDVVLAQLAQYMERDLESSQRLKSALAYPSVIAIAAIGVVVMMATFVLPKLMTFFTQFGVKKRPLSTRILLGVSDFFKHQWYVTPIAIVLVIALVVWMKSTPRGNMFRDRLLLRAWLIRDITRYAAIERFCRIIGAMLKAGVPLPEAMRAAMDSVNNKVFEAKLEQVNVALLEGAGLAAPIAATGIFPIPAVQMIHVGEETGDLDNQLEIAAEYYSSELEYKLKKLMALFEPAIIVFMGLIVGFVAVTMIQSIYGMIQGSNLGK